jgi:hypothetical protein
MSLGRSWTLGANLRASRSLIFLALLLAQCVASAAESEDVDSGRGSLGESERRDLVSMIVTQVNENYSRLGAVELTYEHQCKTDIAVLEEMIGRPLPPERRKSFPAESRVRTYTYVCFGDKSRFEPHSEDGTGSLYLCVDGGVTQYQASKKRAWIRPHQRSPAIFPPYRIADIGFDRVVFPDCIRDWRCTDAEVLTDEQGETQVRLTHRSGAEENQVSQTEFSSQFSYLPTRRFVFHEEGSIHSAMAFEYQQIVENQAWVLRRFTRSRFPQGVHRDTEGSDPSGWSQQEEMRLVDSQILTDVSDSLFSVGFPDGTFVMDAVNGRNYVTGSPRKDESLPPQSTRGRWLLTVCGLFFLVFLLAIACWRRPRSN